MRAATKQEALADFGIGEFDIVSARLSYRINQNKSLGIATPFKMFSLPSLVVPISWSNIARI